MERTIEQDMSIVQVYAAISHLRHDDAFKEIVDLPDRTGAIDFQQEAFRHAFWNYLTERKRN